MPFEFICVLDFASHARKCTLWKTNTPRTTSANHQSTYDCRVARWTTTRRRISFKCIKRGRASGNYYHLSPHIRAHVLCAPPRARYVFLSKGTRTVPFAKPSARPQAAAHGTHIGCNRTHMIQTGGAIIHTKSVTFCVCC